MKTNRLLFSVVLFSLFLCCSQATEPEKNGGVSSELKIELLKRIYKLDVTIAAKIEEFSYFERTGSRLETGGSLEEFFMKLKDESSDIGFRRTGILALGYIDLEGVENYLVEVLKNAQDAILRLNAARALAYRGRKDGLELLRSCAAGDLALSSSGFEQHAAALALLLLGERLPQAYLASNFADPLYVKLSN